MDQFLSPFSPSLYIASLTQDTHALDTFQTAHAHLTAIHNSLLSQLTLRNETQKREREGTRRRRREVEEAIDNVEKSFEDMKNRIGQVGSATLTTGEQMETIDKERIHIQHCRAIISAFLELNREQVTAQAEEMFQSAENEQDLKMVTLLKNLMTLSKEIQPAGTELARKRIADHAAQVESALLAQFEYGYKTNDVEVMAMKANALYTLNGGASCAQTYISQHRFFTETPDYNFDHDDATIAMIKMGVVHELAQPMPFSHELQELYDTIMTLILEEWKVISAVFKEAVTVMEQFLRRVYALMIQTNIDKIMQSSTLPASSLTYLRTLNQVHVMTQKLFIFIVSFGNTNLKGSTPTENTTTSAALSKASSGNIFQPNNAEMTTVHKHLSDLFAQYLEGGRYLEREHAFIKSVVNAICAPYAQVRRVVKGKALVNKITAQAHLSTFSPPGSPPGSPEPVSKIGSPFMSRGSSAPNTQPQSPDGPGANEGMISYQNFKIMLDAHAESIERVNELCNPEEIASAASLMFLTLLESVGERLLEPALDNSIEDLAASLDNRGEPDFRALYTVNNVSSLVAYVQEHFQAIVLPVVLPSASIHRDVVTQKNDLFGRIETKINQIIQRYIDAITIYLGTTLSKHKKTEYKPKESDMNLNLQTPTCTIICDFLYTMYSYMERCLDGVNLENVIIEICVNLHGNILEHLRRSVISIPGGLVVSKNLGAFLDVINSFKIPLLTTMYDSLRQIGNIFLVRPENLRNLLEEGLLARLDAKFLWSFVMARADYKQAKSEVLAGGFDRMTLSQGDLIHEEK